MSTTPNTRRFIFLEDLDRADFDAGRPDHFDPDDSPTGEYAQAVKSLDAQTDEEGGLDPSDGEYMADWEANDGEPGRYVREVDEGSSRKVWEYVEAPRDS